MCEFKIRGQCDGTYLPRITRENCTFKHSTTHKCVPINRLRNICLRLCNKWTIEKQPCGFRVRYGVLFSPFCLCFALKSWQSPCATRSLMRSNTFLAYQASLELPKTTPCFWLTPPIQKVPMFVLKIRPL